MAICATNERKEEMLPKLEHPRLSGGTIENRTLSVLKETNHVLRGIRKRRILGGSTACEDRKQGWCGREKLEHDVVVMLNNHGHSVRVTDTSIESSVALYRNCFYKLDIGSLSPSEKDLVVMLEQKIKISGPEIAGVHVKLGTNNTKVFMPSNHKDFVGKWEPGAAGAAAILSKFDNRNYPLT